MLSQVTNTYDFTQSIYVFFVVLSVVFLAIFFKILAIKKKRVIKILSYMYLGFLLGVSINIYVLLNNRSLPQPFLCIQLLLILLLLGNLYYNTKTLVKDIEEIQENNAYREIALKDKLTGLYNRYAFEHDILEIDNNTLEHLGIVSMDINNLKYYNDTLGHLVGDKLIKEAAKLISDVFPQVYRTGGDEFIALITDETIEILDEKKEMLLRKVIKYNKNENNDIIVEIATGYSKYKFGDSSYEQILVRSDAEMYKHKEQLKSRSVIKSVR